MKIFRKVFALTVALTAIAASSAMAANEASYENGVITADVAYTDEVATVAVVAKTYGQFADAADATGIEYVNQGDVKTLLANGIVTMNELPVASNYEVRVGADKAVVDYEIPEVEYDAKEAEPIVGEDGKSRIGFDGSFQVNGKEFTDILFLLSNGTQDVEVSYNDAAWNNKFDITSISGEVTFGLEIANVPADVTVTFNGIDVK